MTTDLDESLLADLAEPLVVEFSPAERDELFALLSEAHFNHPEAFASTDKGGGPLAFGLPELTVLLTPVMLAAMNEVVRYVVEKAVARGTKATANAIRRLLGRGRTTRPAATPGPAPQSAASAEPAEEELVLTPEQWSEVRQIVLRVARKGGVPDGQASLIADAVVGQGHRGGDTA